MDRSPYLCDRIADHVATTGNYLPARRAAARWALGAPALAGLTSPAKVAAVGRAAGPGRQDTIVAGLLGQAPGDEWAELTVLAVLAPRIGWCVGRWRAAGIPGQTLVDREADLTVEVWVAVRTAMSEGPRPPRPGLGLVDAARSRTRSEARTAGRRRARTDIAVAGGRAGTDGRSGELLLAEAIVESVAAGRLGLGPARALWLTRVTGYPSVEAARLLDTSPAVVRALRSRAVSCLAGGLAEVG